MSGYIIVSSIPDTSGESSAKKAPAPAFNFGAAGSTNTSFQMPGSTNGKFYLVADRKLDDNILSYIGKPFWNCG